MSHRTVLSALILHSKAFFFFFYTRRDWAHDGRPVTDWNCDFAKHLLINVLPQSNKPKAFGITSSEYANIMSPPPFFRACVSFGPRNRSIGAAAKSQVGMPRIKVFLLIKDKALNCPCKWNITANLHLFWLIKLVSFKDQATASWTLPNRMCCDTMTHLWKQDEHHN